MSITSKICQAPNCDRPRDLKQRSSLCVMHRVRRSRNKSYGSKEDDAIIPFENINRNTKAMGKVCSVSNCNTKVYKHGTICSKHHRRQKKYGQYDLPSHKGTPNLPIVEKLPEGIVKNCKKHGHLSKEKVYIRYHKGKENYFCKICLIDINIKKKYVGMNGLEDYDKILLKQNGSCAICKGQNTTTRNGKIKRFAIDHCHDTKKVRGLLCAFCNAVIGYARDNVSILESAIKYLKEASDGQILPKDE